MSKEICKFNSGRFTKGCIPWMKGKRFSEESKLKMSLSHKGPRPWMVGKHHSEEAKRKMSLSRKGKSHSEDTKQKMSLAHKGLNTWMKGRHLSDETKRKIGDNQRGEKGSNWKGGVSQHYIRKLSGRGWDKIRHEVYERDNWTCQICGKTQIKIHAHHMVPYRISQDDSLENLITLCISCHMREEYKYYKKLKE